jgi:hypothetical protein
MTPATMHELLDSLGVPPLTAGHAPKPAPAPGAPDTRSPIDRERAAVAATDPDGTFLNADGLFSEDQLTALSPAQRQELYRRFPTLATESAKTAVAAYFASGRRDQHSN